MAAVGAAAGVGSGIAIGDMVATTAAEQAMQAEEAKDKFIVLGGKFAIDNLIA
jgi:hypothetical protein